MLTTRKRQSGAELAELRSPRRRAEKRGEGENAPAFRLSDAVEAARGVARVLDVLTFKNADSVRPLKTFSEGGQAGSSIVPLSSSKIWHDGQIVAMVVAETFEGASEAATKIVIRYDEEAPSATFGSPGTETKAVADVDKTHKDPVFGDAKQAFDAAPVKVDADYGTPPSITIPWSCSRPPACGPTRS